MAVQSRRVKGMLFLSPEPVSQVDTVVLLSGARLHQLCNAEEAVKPRIKAQNPLDAMLFHDREMNRVTGRQPPIFQNDLPGALDRRAIDWQNLRSEERRVGKESRSRWP